MNISRQDLTDRAKLGGINMELGMGGSTVRIGVPMEPQFVGCMISLNSMLPFPAPRANEGMPFAYKTLELEAGNEGRTLILCFSGINKLSADAVREKLPMVAVAAVFKYLEFIGRLNHAISGLVFKLVD